MDTRDLLKTGAEWLVVLILVVAALPLMAVGAWVLRAVLVAAALVALLSGCILYCVYPRFRDWTHHVAHHTNEASS
jgi:ABC-type branched-subunit amino acid transport system permease subunit